MRNCYQQKTCELKWSKIHIYAQDGVITKIKTYPHESISQRTEEFYADEDGLLLVVIEDNGQEEKGKSEDDIDKMYFYNNGDLIKETKKGEDEYTIRESDAEELLAEYKEYLSFYAKNKAP